MRTKPFVATLLLVAAALDSTSTLMLSEQISKKNSAPKGAEEVAIDGNGSQLVFKRRAKRDVILDAEKLTMLDDKPRGFSGKDFKGLRQDSVLSIRNTKPLWGAVEHFHGILVHWNHIVTPCSCVTFMPEDICVLKPDPGDGSVYSRRWHFDEGLGACLQFIYNGSGGNANNFATWHDCSQACDESPSLINSPWRQNENHETVTNIDGSIFLVRKMRLRDSPRSVSEVRGKEVYKHPSCDSQYDVDLAVLTIQDRIEGSKLAWVHTAENLIFNMNMDRVVAAQAITGKCTVPVYLETTGKRAKRRKYDIVQKRVYFQNWAACRPLVCPKGVPGKGLSKTQLPFRCNNEHNGTRYCLGWKQPIDLCKLSPGTPVFCDVGQIFGVMGFLVSKTYLCRSSHGSIAVMQGFNDGIGFVREFLSIRLSPGYEQALPDWIKNARAYYTYHWYPKIIPGPIVTIPPYVAFSSFAGTQARSIVNIHNDKGYNLCQGTLVTHVLAVAPCSCLTEASTQGGLKDATNNHIIKNTIDPGTLNVSLLTDFFYRRRPTVKVDRIVLHPQCDSIYTSDYALVELKRALPGTKLAWIMTADNDTFTKMLRHLPPADALFSGCHFVKHELIDGVQILVEKQISFENWGYCLHNVCADRVQCFGDGVEDPSSNLTRFCIRSSIGEDLCDMQSGSPVFCNVEEARGFVGFVSKAWWSCLSEKANRDAAIFLGIDKFIFAFKEKLWIHRVENDIKRIPSHSSSPPTMTFSYIIWHLPMSIVSFFLQYIILTFNH